MTNKDKFIQEIKNSMANDGGLCLSADAKAYFDELCNNKESDGKLTEAGEKVLTWIRDNTTKDMKLFSPIAIGAALFIPPRSVSGAARKLVNDGYLYKEGKAPVSYGITQSGCQVLPERN